MFTMTTTTLQLLAALALTFAAPAAASNRGEITFFEPGLGACGQTHGAHDMITAVSKHRYDGHDVCGGRIRVRGRNGDAIVTVVDRCEACAYNDLDLSPAAFQQAIGDLGIGRTEANWEWI